MPDTDTAIDEAMQLWVDGMASMLEMGKTVIEAVDGYRAECTRHGYSESAAEVMAVDFHRALTAATLGRSAG